MSVCRRVLRALSSLIEACVPCGRRCRPGHAARRGSRRRRETRSSDSEEDSPTESLRVSSSHPRTTRPDTPTPLRGLSGRAPQRRRSSEPYRRVAADAYNRETISETINYELEEHLPSSGRASDGSDVVRSSSPVFGIDEEHLASLPSPIALYPQQRAPPVVATPPNTVAPPSAPLPAVIPLAPIPVLINRPTLATRPNSFGVEGSFFFAFPVACGNPDCAVCSAATEAGRTATLTTPSTHRITISPVAQSAPISEHLREEDFQNVRGRRRRRNIAAGGPVGVVDGSRNQHGGAGDVGGDERGGGPGYGDVESDAASESGGRELPADD